MCECLDEGPSYVHRVSTKEEEGNPDSLLRFKPRALTNRLPCSMHVSSIVLYGSIVLMSCRVVELEEQLERALADMEEMRAARERQAGLVSFALLSFSAFFCLLFYNFVLFKGRCVWL